MKHLLAHHGARRINHVKTDSKIVYDGMQHRDWRRLAASDISDAWAEVEECCARLEAADLQVVVYKVKGHITQAMVDADVCTALDKEGNDKADALASRGASMAQISDADSESIESWDSRAMHIQRRLLLVISHRAGLARDAPTRNVCYDGQLLRCHGPTLDDRAWVTSNAVSDVAKYDS
jgi:ribonuclease HI